VVLVDDHLVVRDGLAALLTMESDLEVVGCAGDLPSAVELVRASRPNLIICDLNLPGVSGGQAARVLRSEFADVVLLILTAHDSLEYIRAAFAAGAIGYVCKDASRSELLRAIRRAASGRRTVCGRVWAAVLDDWLDEGTAPVHTGLDALDPEAREVVRLIALGMPTWRIAQAMERGVKAMEKYRLSLYRRLGVRSSAGLTRFAVEHQLVSSHEIDRILSEGES
jgi:two-component system nitrate/nitrite response regulator NarL